MYSIIYRIPAIPSFMRLLDLEAVLLYYVDHLQYYLHNAYESCFI